MNLQDLSRYYRLQEQIGEDKEVLESLRRKAVPASPNLSGTPHALGVSDKVGDLAIEIADLEKSICRKEKRAEVEKHRLLKLINTIDDSRIRTLFRLRFVRCLSWIEVADIMGRYYTANSVKHICYGYLKQQETQ